MNGPKEFTLSVDVTPSFECPGNVYRYRERNYQTKNGYRNGFELILLKKQSCLGCEQCDYDPDDELADHEYRIEIDGVVEDGDMVQLGIVVDSTDWETGYADDWHVVARKVTP